MCNASGKRTKYKMWYGALMMLALHATSASGARILAVFPNYLKSHSIFTHAIAKELAARGHEVTAITPFEIENAPPTYRQIPAKKDTLWKMDLSDEEMEMFFNGDIPVVVEEFERYNALAWFTETGLNSTAVKNFIANDRSRYDLVIVELFLQEAFLMFAHKYKAPIVMLGTFGSSRYTDYQMGNSMSLSVMPYEFVDFATPMSLSQRVKNVALVVFHFLTRKWYHMPMQQALAEKYFESYPKPLPRLTDLERNVSMVLVNTHFSIDTVRPNVPGIVEVGGVHIEKRGQLTPEFKKICDESKDGVVLFSLGSIVKSSRFPRKKIDGVLKAFAGLKQTVLWKWEGDDTPKASKNVKFFKWLPQSDILAHPNTKAFITHCGLLSIQESVYYGVPVIGMPFFGDQFLNIDRAVKKGYGIRVLYRTLTEASLGDALSTILHDPSYADNARALSARFRDQPMSPLDTATYWIEYVMRHGGQHLRSSIAENAWYERLLLDVVAITMLGSVIVGVAAYCCVWVLCRLLWFRKPAKRRPKRDKEH